MPMFFRKVSACKLLLRAFSFSKKLAMKAIKQRPGLLALLRVLDRAAWRRVKEDFNILKAREAVCLIIGLLRMFKTAEWLKSKCFDLLVKRYRLSIVAAKCGLVGSASKQLAFGSIYGYSSMLKREANNHSEVTMIPSIIGTEPEQVILEPPIIHGSSPEKLFLPKLLSVESSLNVSTIAVPSVPVPSELVSTFPLHPAPISQEQSPPSISNASPGEIPSDFISENRLYANQVE